MEIVVGENILERLEPAAQAAVPVVRDVFTRLSSKTLPSAEEGKPGTEAVAVHLLKGSHVRHSVLRGLSSMVSGIWMQEQAQEGAVEMTAKIAALAARASAGTLSEAQREALEREFRRIRAELEKTQKDSQESAIVPFAVEEEEYGEEGDDESPFALESPSEEDSEASAAAGKKARKAAKEMLAADAELVGGAEAASREIKVHADQGIEAQANVPAEAALGLL